MTTLVLGLDGAAFELLDEWLKRGELSNIERLQNEGIATDMRSCLPPVTCPNWRCYTTGVNPGKLGVFWWEDIDRETETISNASSADQFDGTEYWTAISEQTAVINFPTGFPPSNIDGDFIAGGPGSEQSGFTSPEKLEASLRSRFDYQVHPEQLGLLEKTNEDNPCIDEIHRLIDLRFDVVEEYLSSGEYELIHATVFYINVLQHFYWNKDVVLEAWRHIDERIGDLLDSPRLDDLIIMSDHGSNRIDTEFHINTWLEQQGYLVRKSSTSDLLHTLGLTRERVRPLLNQFGLEWWARKLLPAKVKDLLPDSDGRVKKSAKAEAIDWGDSKAIASGQGPVYILSNEETERRDIRNELLRKLDGLEGPGGQTVVSAARPAESVWEGPYVDEGPDLVLEQAPNVYIDGSIGANDAFEGPGRWMGENKDTGLFIAYGSSFRSDATLEDMHILDIAPTLLHQFGEDVPNEMDGRPRVELFAPGTDAASRTVSYSDQEWVTERDDAHAPAEGDVQDRLSDLGYLSE
ncbi:nucleotide pyrophosphatase [Halorubrum sp. SS5]|nr:nucleotide pyrophosphatase [Halorubrum sp. SS5]